MLQVLVFCKKLTKVPLSVRGDERFNFHELVRCRQLRETGETWRITASLFAARCVRDIRPR